MAPEPTAIESVQSPPLLRPDTLLHIYYLSGVLPPHDSHAHPAFVGNWVEEDFSFLFFTAPAEEYVQEVLARYPELALLDQYEMTYGDWQGGQVEPICIGRFLLNPTWIKASPSEGDIAITLDSGVVFGNGAHPTTQACLEAIEIASSGGKVKTVLDLGCGTGILALAAAKLGARKVLAVDYNFLAVQTTRRNVELNGLGETILTINGRAEEHTATPSDLLVANIHYDVMKDLIRTPGFLQQKWFILSGLLQPEVPKIVEYLKSQPVLILKKWSPDDVWTTILGITTD